MIAIVSFLIITVTLGCSAQAIPSTDLSTIIPLLTSQLASTDSSSIISVLINQLRTAEPIEPSELPNINWQTTLLTVLFLFILTECTFGTASIAVAKYLINTFTELSIQAFVTALLVYNLQKGILGAQSAMRLCPVNLDLIEQMLEEAYSN